MSNEIKVGDKVRVREDAPKVYLRGWGKAVEYNVYAVDGDAAIITYGHQEIAIPTKYLVKVEGEKKEAKFKNGDRVRVRGYGYEPNLHKGDIGEILDTNDKEQCFVLFKKSQAWIYADCLEPYTEPSAPEIKTGDRVRNIERGLIGVVDKIVYGNIVWVNGVDGKRYHWKSDELELVEPTEQTEAEKKPYDGISEETANELSDMLEGYYNAMETIKDKSYWTAYAADLAKEIVLKLIGKDNDEQMLADYAVKVAKAVVEGLKRK